MKRLTAIFLFVLFLFNLAGYRLLFHFLGKQAETKYETLIDNQQYEESNLLTIKVDINMPYQVERTDFERVSGSITVDGIVYQYVKRRIYNGQLVLLCIPNEDRTKLSEAKNKYLEWTNDLASKGSNKESSSKTSVQKNVFSDYECQVNQGLTSIEFTLDTNNVLSDEALPHSINVLSPGKPPQFIMVI